MKVVLLGAGASRGTFRFERTPVPVSAEFGSVLSATQPNWDQKYPDLPKIVAHLGLHPTNWSLEAVWTCVDYHSKFFNVEKNLSVLPDPPAWTQPGVDLKRALLDVYGKRCDDAAEELPADASYTLGELLQGFASDDVLISFNYDTIAERVARKFGLALRSPNKVDASLPNGPRFAKPHGSTSWLTIDQDRSVVCSQAAGPLLESLTVGGLRAGENPLLLGAVPIKSELIREIQFACDASGRTWRSIFETVAAQWRTVVDAVRIAETIVAVGYSFPPEDQYGRFLFREALRPRRTKPMIEFFERQDRAPERAAEIMRVFACHAERLRYRGPVQHPL